ncbi:polymorphic toxin-type HINT domain-containing protein [Streptomyces sp. NPDC005863]|uniref:polymorphic toxin-type HINT domain-containing protein n=1 Tax=unclassified Streptomyces TaxID=2593676 RepID=UPI0033FE29BC
MNGISRPRQFAVFLRRGALAVSAVMVATVLQAVGAPMATADGNGRPSLPSAERPIKGRHGIVVKPRKVAKGSRTPAQAPRAAWPKAGSAVVDVPRASTETAVKPVKADGLPVAVGAPKASAAYRRSVQSGKAAPSTTHSEVKARVLSQKATKRAGVQGVLLALEAREVKSNKVGRVQATVNYSDFAEAFGGGYASRLTLVQLPACALKTPEKQQCRRPQPVKTVNDTEKQTLTADAVALKGSGPTVLAAVAAEESANGDYKATSLSPSATWKTDLNTGDFTWSYDMPVPGVPGDLKPEVGISYSSGSIDGRSGSTNNQSSWVGDGFDLWPGYIERKYKTCSDDGEKHADGNKPGDQCWDYDNAFVTFNGHGGELVPAGDGEFKFTRDDGSRIKKLTSTNRGNGDNDGEYWRLTDPQGVRYYFGYNRLPGWADGKATTNSAWTAPVFGNDSGEPCHKDTFANSWCQQAWRWNLDYVVDPHGNAIAYYYDQEKNSYGRNLEAKANTRYVRGGSLDRIEYGLKSSSMYGTKPLAKVSFDTSERCLPNSSTDCSDISKDAFYWYDTPWDMNCAEAADCDKGRLAPTFFTRKRLTGVTTQVLNGDTYSPVDSWKLGHRWGQADVDYQLLLDSVQRTGHTDAPAVTLPKTTFAYTQLANRLDKTGDGYAPFIKARLSTVADESGGQIDVNYTAPACDWGALPTPETNATRCFPQYIGGDADDDPERQWFNKYVVTATTTTDRTGGAPDAVTTYEYLGDAAWHYDDDDGLTKKKFKTWSQWRGYGHVRVKTGGQGGGDALKSQDDTYFLRGMDGDRKASSGGTKNVSVPLGNDEGDPITDHEATAGYAYKTASYSKPGGSILAKTVNRPWHHETAKKVRDWGTVTANLNGTSHTKTWTSLDNGAGTDWRTTSKATDYDTVAGRVTQIDGLGDNTTASDNQCTRTTYATNTADNILTLPSRQETVAAKCADTPDRSEVVLSDVRTAYDGGAYGAAPTKGDATATSTLKKHDGTEATYLESGATFDGYGRQLTATDLTADITATGSGDPVRTARKDGRTTTTAYSPAAGYAMKITKTTPPAEAGDTNSAQTTVTELEPLRGQPKATVDTNGNRTELTYDALGRSAKVWLADRRTSQTPSHQFTYFVDEGQPAAVRTQTLNNEGGQTTSYTLYDGQLRERQTQAPGPSGGRILTDIFYNERGLPNKAFAPYYAQGAPSRTLFKPANGLSVESQTHTSYDGLSRAVEERQIAGNGDGGTVLGITKTTYGGDRTTVIPPEGGIATTTLTDARDQVTELRQHHTRSASAAFDTTKYAHTPRGELSKVTDPEGNTWAYTYDQLGRQTEISDPDKGTTSNTYDDRGQLTTSTDARHTTLATLYDDLGRRTELRKDSASGELRAKWVYDTIAGAKGQLAESTRYVDGAAYTTKVTSYDRQYRPTKTALVIPASEGALQGTYQTGTAYKPSGLVGTISYSAAGSLPGGSYTTTYDKETLRPISVLGDGFQADTSYSLTGKPLQYTLGNTSGGKKTWATNTYEWGSQRLSTARVDREEQSGVDQHATYAYDQAGNILSVSDVSRTGTDTQCFSYDHLRRMTQAWTQGDKTCAAASVGDKISGPAPYWHSYTYDKTGNRLTETLHDTAGDSTKDTKRTYAYPEPGKPQAHTLTSVTTEKPGGTTTRDSYGYDETGNTTTRTLRGDTQKLSWDIEGHLAKVTEPVAGEKDKVTEYVYDTEGNRLIGRSPTETTLYLGHSEVTLPKGAAKAKATRYTPLGGGHQAVTEDNGAVSFITADPNGTEQLAVKAADLTLNQRRTLPFGGPRGEAPKSWPGTKGFVGGTEDTAATGLTHLGAREYDPSIGRFISVDPLLQTDIPQTLNGYSYGAQNPLTQPDPSGLGLKCGGGDPACPKHGSDGHDTPEPPVTSLNNQSTHAYYSTVFAADQGRPYVRNSKNTSPKEFHRAMVKYQGAYDGPINDAQWMMWLYGWDEEAIDNFGPCLIFDCSKQVTSDDVNSIPLNRQNFDELFGRGLAEAWGSRLGLKSPKAGRISGCKCFLAGTDVLMADGTTKDIEDVKLGDKVRATDPETGETGDREVTAAIVTDDDKQFAELTISTAGGLEKLTATQEHPFWSDSQHDWVDAGDLKRGMTLRTEDGRTATVAHIRSYQDHARTYNLTVRGLHTYYVLAGATPVLVHNSTPCGPDLDALSQSGKRPAKGNTTHAGREYQKHMNRGERGELPVIPGKQLKSVGQDLLDDILTNPKTATSPVNSGNFAGGTRYIMPDPAGGRGIGATFDANGQFQYFGRY